MMKLLKRLGIFFVTVIIAVMSFELGRHQKIASKTQNAELERAIPPLYSTGAKPEACVEPNERESALIKTAVDVLAFSREESNFLGIGAEKFLGNGLYRRDGKSSRRVCDSPEQMERASNLIRGSYHLRRGRLVEYDLRLIAKLPSPGEDLAKAAAESAFNGSRQQSEIFPERDIRPLARATLASLGPLARPYADQAYAQMSIDDAMGTGAAQVAVAGGHPNALQSVERLMAEKLASLPKGKAVPWELRNRLYEMAYALAFGGAQAKEHVAPLRDLMSLKVQSWAPPFGMVELPPRRMCDVVVQIMQQPVDNPEFGFCSDNGPYEQ